MQSTWFCSCTRLGFLALAARRQRPVARTLHDGALFGEKTAWALLRSRGFSTSSVFRKSAAAASAVVVKVLLGLSVSDSLSPLKLLLDFIFFSLAGYKIGKGKPPHVWSPPLFLEFLFFY
ncbi:hypothetical protein IscW_ISCW009713 [Ixodes scapularis]|uniref:Uncharacterized protein n=1 Tax=Ixodes scapularis TaxID=6945 RepID=B7Q3T7_IXOSC|nr:hypothetical protein IscW_ISCW009713 [Ixodes scapularis]|eukprot:XP_002411385.1 hypothetical protein IscW_ISCW009713 [Ixodes scapularis]